MRILIVKLSSLGDVIHTFPALSDLAAARPDVEVDWLVEEAFAPLVRLHPAVREVHAVRFRRLRWPPARWPRALRDTGGLVSRLRARRYDLVVDLQGLMKSAVIARLAGGNLAGYDRDSAREPAATRLYRHRFRVERRQHAVERTRRLLAAAVGYAASQAPGRFSLAAPGRPAIDGLPARYALILQAASWPTKLWPEERWRELMARMAGEGRALVIPWGNAAERERAGRLAAGLDDAFVLPSVLAGAELAGVIGHADFAVGLDSGLMHVAAALEVPGVWLYGPTDPGLTGPYGGGQVVVRSTYSEAPCRRRICDREAGGDCCMRRIEIGRVAAAISAVAPG